MNAKSSIKPLPVSPSGFVKLFAAAISAFGVLGLLPSPASAEGLSLIRTVYLEHGAVVDPKAIVRTHDGGLIIVGSIDHKNQPKNAWATKTNSEGKVIWRYSIPPREQLTNFQGPDYSSAAVMPDDSVFLCGGMPGTREGGGLLTHLDKDGKVLSEQLLKPEGFSGGGFNSCIAWGDGLAVVGGTMTFERVPPTASHPLPYNSQAFYWILDVDIDGKKKWEKLVPVTDKALGIVNYKSPLQSIVGGNFIFAAVRGNFVTEMVRVKPNGDITTKILDEPLVMVSKVGATKDIQLISVETGSLTSIKLDSDLQEIERITKAHDLGETDMAYRLSNESFIIFGAKHNKEDTYYAARVMSVDSKLNNEKTLLLGSRGESYHAKAGVPLDKPGEFASVRRAIKPSNLGITATDEQLDQIRLGVALDFIRVQ